MEGTVGQIDPGQDKRLALLQDAVRQIGRLCCQLEQLAHTDHVADGATQAELSRDAHQRFSQIMASAQATTPLTTFLAKIDELTVPERQLLVDAAITMLEHVYVHLPLKRAMYAIDPVRRLQLLRQDLEALPEPSARSFHDAMISIFHSLRDLHTNYILPKSYQGFTAFLPFLVEECFESNPQRPQWLVTKVAAGFASSDFKPGVRLTHWNGIPMERAVELNAQREAGSNPDARHARGLEALTLRPMALTSPPDEEWVTVTFATGAGTRELRVPWMVFEPPASPQTGIDLNKIAVGLAHVLGVDALSEAMRRAKKTLFVPQEITKETRMTAAASDVGLMPETRGSAGADARPQAGTRPGTALFAAGLDAMAIQAEPDAAHTSLMPDLLAFRRIERPGGALGYIRIWSFMAQDADAFVAEFSRIARMLPQNGLIIDVRGNGGGNILAGEKLLQVLTPNTIDPERLHFIGTPTTLELCSSDDGTLGLQKWVEPLKVTARAGDVYSRGFYLEEPIEYNRVGQQYQGPVVLIIDALCYSTTDIFSAQFQDHGIGPILGVHARTGAGGANVWEYTLLEDLLPGRFKPLPKGANMRVAIRRTTRTRERAGLAVEDLGVEAEVRHFMTRQDILGDNKDLIAKAAGMLERLPVRALEARVVAGIGPGLRLAVNARKVSWVDAYACGRPVSTADIEAGQAVLDLPEKLGNPEIELRGYDDGALVITLRVTPQS